jgi:hypothetical protein
MFKTVEKGFHSRLLLWGYIMQQHCWIYLAVLQFSLSTRTIALEFEFAQNRRLRQRGGSQEL